MLAIYISLLLSWTQKTLSMTLHPQIPKASETKTEPKIQILKMTNHKKVKKMKMKKNLCMKKWRKNWWRRGRRIIWLDRRKCEFSWKHLYIMTLGMGICSGWQEYSILWRTDTYRRKLIKEIRGEFSWSFPERCSITTTSQTQFLFLAILFSLIILSSYIRCRTKWTTSNSSQRNQTVDRVCTE